MNSKRRLKCPECGNTISGEIIKNTLTGERSMMFKCECGASISHPPNMKIKKVVL